MQDETLAKMNLPPRDDYLFSLWMMKEKCSAMQFMREEFDKTSKEIDNFKVGVGTTWADLVSHHFGEKITG